MELFKGLTMSSMKDLMLDEPSLLSQAIAPAFSRKCLDLAESALDFERALTLVMAFLLETSTKGGL